MRSREELDAAREERLYREEQKRRYKKDLHSGMKQAATTYKNFSGKKHQATENLMPMAARRHVEVGTESTDDEWMSFELHRAKLDAAADVLEANIHDLLEPLDTTRLLNRAHGVLQKKVNARMKREGVPVAKRNFVNSELVGVLEDTFHSQPDLRSPSAVAEAEAAMKPRSPAKSPVASPSHAYSSPGNLPREVADTFELSKGSTTALVEPTANASPTFATLDAAVSPGSGTAMLSGASPDSDTASPPKPDVSSIELGNTTGAEMARPADITFGDTLISPTKGEVTGDLSFSEEESGLQKSFLAADEDQDGLITRAEATAALKGYGQGGEDTSFRLLDTDQDGKINMSEFKTLVMSGIQKRLSEFEMTAEGFMTLNDLKKVTSILGSPVVDDEAVRALPADSDGRVNYFEYCRAAQKPADAAVSPGGARRMSKEYTSVLLKDALNGE
jgi:Ca2+-binding EF-hand superfamily protein